MELRTLEITVISFMGLEAANFYLVGPLFGNKSNEKQRTPIHKDGSMNHSSVFTVDKAAAHVSRLNFQIMAKRTFSLDKDVGEVDVLVRDLLVEGGAGDGKPKVLSYRVRSPSGKAKGVLKFSYKFREAAPPPAGYPPNSVPPYGYPLLGYWYAAPPPASQAPPKKSRCKIFMPMIEFLSKLPIGDCISNSVYDTGVDGDNDT